MSEAQQAMPDIQLRATYFLDEDWQPTYPIPQVIGAKSAGADEQVRDWIRSTTIKIAPHAETVKLTPPPHDPGFEYLKAELGMNVILPKGHIDELRFKVTLIQEGGAQETFATDGFPNSSIHDSAVLSGQVKIGISKAFKLIPVVGDLAAELLSIDLNPWSFRVGSLKHIDVAFNGGLTAEPDWYFKKTGMQNDEVRIAMILKKSSATTAVKAKVQVGWLYNPGILHKTRVGSDINTLTIYGP